MKTLHQDPLAYLNGKADPYPELAQLLEGNPAVLFPDNYWLISGYDACRQISLDQENLSVKSQSKDKIVPYLFGMDPPEHLFARKRAAKLFSKNTVQQLTDRANGLAEELSSQIGNEPFDFVQDYAFALPAQTIAFLLGVEKNEQSQFNRWVQFLMQSPQSLKKGSLSVSRFDQVTQEIDTFFSHKLESYADASSDRPILYSWFYQLDEAIPTIDFLKFLRTLMFAGIITVSCLISNTLRAFQRNPHLWNLAQGNPQFLSKILEESLRYDAPVCHSSQLSVQDFYVGDILIPANHLVIAFFSMANRDSSIFESPHEFNPLRKESGKHLSFGYGPHACLGAHLGRMMAHAAFSTLLERFSGFTFGIELTEIKWLTTTFLRGPKALPVRFYP